MCYSTAFFFVYLSEINDHEGGSRSALDTNSCTGTKWGRKLLSAKRSLIVNIKALITNLRVASASQSSYLVKQFEDVGNSVWDFTGMANNIWDPNVSQFLEKVDFYFEECRKTRLALHSATRRALDNPNEDELYNGLEPTDSVSQVTAPVSTFSTSKNYWHVR